MRVETSFLRSRIALRIFALFVVASLVPIIALTLLAHLYFSRSYESNIELDLRESTKGYGIALFERLSNADVVLRSASQESGDPKALARLALSLSGSLFLGFAIVFEDGRPPLYLAGVRGHTDELGPFPGAVPPGRPGATRIALLQQDTGPVRVALALDLASGPYKGAELRAILAPDYLWGRADEFDPGTSICVTGPGNSRLYCSNPRRDLSLAAEPRPAATDAGQTPAGARSDGFLTQSWDLFVGSRFQGESWQIFQAIPKEEVLGQMSGFQDIFVRVLLLTLLLIVMGSIYLIRRSFTPLESLMDGIQRIEHGEFDRPVTLDNRDEFGALARAFNHMAARLNRQLLRLTALSLIDRGIIAREPTPEIVANVLSQARSISDSDLVSIAVADRYRPDTFAVFASRDDPPAQVDPHRQLYTPDAEEQSLLSTGDVNLIERSDNRFVHLFSCLADERHTHLLLAPVHQEGRLVSVLAVGYADGQAIGREELETARELADRVAVALTNAAWEERLQHLAYHDPLTELPNRLLLTDRLSQALAQAERSGECVAVMFIDLDRFKTVNDSLGHRSGDALLQQVAGSLSAQLRNGDTLARLGGDEFVAVIVDLERERRGCADAAMIARKLLAAAGTPFRLQDHEIRPTASLGIALYPGDGADPDALMKNADSAMYHAKALGRSTYQFYSEEMNDRALHRLDVEADLHRALENDELVLYFQPKIDVRRRTIAGVEALVRWRHPTRGMVSPGEFIEVAEETGMIVRLGDWVLNRACRQAMELAALGFGELSMAVNLSPRQFREEGLTGQVHAALSGSGLSPHRLELEITEGSAVENVDRALNVLETFREQGTLISIDDFGVGYASLSYMKKFPVDVLKIDQSFVRNLDSDPKDAAIVSATLGLARSLGLRVVAEGVETQAQFQFLRAHGCDEIQGYLFSRPLPFDELVALLRCGPFSETGRTGDSVTGTVNTGSRRP